MAPDPLVAVKRGLAVFPIPPGGKRPAFPGWQRSALRDVDQVRRVWRPGDNVGIGCWASGVVGLDLDVADGHHNTDVDGADTLAALCAAHGQPWPRTLTVRTPSTGRHLYLRVPAGRVILSSSGGRSPLGPGIDVRGPGRGQRGGYLIGPDSVVHGRRYTVLDDLPIAELPAWMADLLEES
ncbi:bifunctional DNA primase/polymerase [Actinophytocola sp.]|uniref:bifunctional DNA primase/polymerase n=1 Tax=Actinophytocola sp. TaxID=1872138 RepID=UPI002ED3ADEC